MSRQSSVASRRIRGVALALQLGLAALALRLIHIQAVQHRDWAAHAARMQAAAVSLPPQRGLILDRHGRELAVSVRTYSLFANPRAVPPERRDDAARLIAERLNLNADDVRRRLEQTVRETTDPSGETRVRPNYFVWLQRRVSEDAAAALLCATLSDGAPVPGLGADTESARVYPRGKSLAHVIGFVGADGRGLDGLEGRYDALLSGRAGRLLAVRDGLGRLIADADSEVQPVRHGLSIQLTIDARVQEIAEEELAAACARHRPQSACVVIMDPQTSDVLAMASWPDYDPNAFSEAAPTARRNMAVVECIEPGSSFKPFVAAAALDRGLVAPDTRFDCHKGSWTIGRRVLHDVHPYGMLSLRDVIAYSSNIGMAQVGMRLRPDDLYAALQAFGFGRPTGLGLPGETSGILHPVRRWTSLSAASISMGQELACSPIQLVAAFAVFANGGWYAAPRIIAAVSDCDGRRVLWQAPPSERRRVISERTALLMCNDLLAGVVERGTAKNCGLKGYRMAGKTGTAQLARTDGRGYESGAYGAVFVGIAPVESPRYVIGVFLRKPSGGQYYGGTICAPVAARIADRVLSMTHWPRGVPSPHVDPRVASGRGPVQDG